MHDFCDILSHVSEALTLTLRLSEDNDLFERVPTDLLRQVYGTWSKLVQDKDSDVLRVSALYKASKQDCRSLVEYSGAR